jgi:riboflavin synthase
MFESSAYSRRSEVFTGIVAAIGRIKEVSVTETGRRFEVHAGPLASGMQIGDSIAVNGVCLTAVVCAGDEITVDAVGETLDRSNLGDVAVGDGVDLERPLPATGRFDGHIVQGHVDGVGTVAALITEGEAVRMRITVPERLARYVVEKGSIAVDGVSLTVTAVSEGWFEIVLIPHTLAVTVLGDRNPGDRVNLEVDILAKYVERLIESRTG